MAEEEPPIEDFDEEEEVVEMRYPVPPEIGDKMRAAFPYFLRKGGHKTQIPDNTVGTIMRCACINPSEAQVREVDNLCKSKEKTATPRGYYEYDNFEQQVSLLLYINPKCFDRLPKAKIMEALNAIYPGKETAKPEEMKDVFCQKGDKFTLEEFSKMQRAAVDYDTKVVYFDEYADLLVRDGLPPPPDPLEPINESFR